MSKIDLNIKNIDTWGDLCKKIEEVLKEIDSNTTAEESIKRFEALNDHMIQFYKDNEGKVTKENNVKALFGAALDFINGISVKLFYKWIGHTLTAYAVHNLPEDNEKMMEEFTMTVLTILQMSLDSGKLVTIDQCEFISKTELN
jgi:hypothetical protein